jgi:hypothetical protein
MRTLKLALLLARAEATLTSSSTGAPSVIRGRPGITISLLGNIRRPDPGETGRKPKHQKAPSQTASHSENGHGSCIEPR